MLLFGMTALGAGSRSACAQQTTTDESRFREIQAGYEDISPQAVFNIFRRVDMRTPSGFDRVYEVLDSPGLLARRSGSLTAVFPRSVYAGNGTPLIPPGTVFYIGALPVNLQGQGVLASRLAPKPVLAGHNESGRSWHKTSSATTASAMSSNAIPVPSARLLTLADRRADRAIETGVSDSSRHSAMPGLRSTGPSQTQSLQTTTTSTASQRQPSLHAQPTQLSRSIFTSEAYRRQRIAVLIDKASANRRAATAPKPKP